MMIEPAWYSAGPLFESGTAVVVSEGPLLGLRGTVMGCDDNDRLVVQVVLLGGVTPVILEASQVCAEREATIRGLVKH
jgi:transcription antitermination factor NusG